MIAVFAFQTERERDRFTVLYERYRNLLYAKAYDILQDAMLAEDAVSEAYIRVFRNMDKIEGVDSPRTAAFLVTIAKNTALTIYAKRKEEAVPAEDLASLAGADPQVLEDLVMLELTGERVARLVGTLDEQSRHIFLMKYAYDMPHREIAAQCGMTENNVTVKLHRIRRKLADAIEEEKEMHG